MVLHAQRCLMHIRYGTYFSRYAMNTRLFWSSPGPGFNESLACGYNEWPIYRPIVCNVLIDGSTECSVVVKKLILKGI